MLAALVVGALVSLQSFQGKTFWQFVQSSRVELRKVVWPSTQETWQVTLVVFVMIVVLGLFFWGVDTLLGFLDEVADRARRLTWLCAGTSFTPIPISSIALPKD